MLLIGNGQVITRDSDRPYLKDGAVVTDGPQIIAVGELFPKRRHIHSHKDQHIRLYGPRHCVFLIIVFRFLLFYNITDYFQLRKPMEDLSI